MSHEVKKDERVVVIPLKRAYIRTRWRRVEVAMSLLKKWATRHLKAKEVKVSSRVNEALWSKGAQSPLRRLKVKVVKDEGGTAWVRLEDEEA